MRMKTIGLLGGMSWESSSLYYSLLNKMAQEEFGGSYSCPCILYSFDFHIIDNLQHQGKWKALNESLAKAAKSLELSGAELLIICTNTMHLIADDIQSSIGIPVVHIVDAVASEIKNRGLNRVGLLGTKFTMEKSFFSNRLKEKHNISCIVPPQKERELIHNVIYTELIRGKIVDKSKAQYIEIIEKLKENGAEGIILGCTEIPMLVKQEDASIPIFDTTSIHAAAAFAEAIKKN